MPDDLSLHSPASIERFGADSRRRTIRPEHPAFCPEITDGRIAEAIERLGAGEKDFWTAKDSDRTDAAHGLFQYPAMMVPSVQRGLIGAITSAAPHTKTLFDPFVGAATSVVAGMAFGLNCVGQDINPLAVLLARVRTCVTPINLIEAVAETTNRADRDQIEKVEADFENIEKWFGAPVVRDLSKLKRAIREQRCLATRRFLWVVLAETIRLTSNDRTSTFKLHARPADEIARRRPEPIKVFSVVGQANAESLIKFRKTLEAAKLVNSKGFVGTVSFHLSDTSQNCVQNGGQGFDILITSPPYGDNATTVPYGQHSYLPLQWIDLEDIDEIVDRNCLRTTQQIDRISLGGATPADYTSVKSKLCDISPTARTILDSLKSKPMDKEKKVVSFVHGLNRALENSVAVLAGNAYLAFTVGNRTVGGETISNIDIISELLGALGAKELLRIERKIYNKRMAFRNSTSPTMASETITIYRKVAHV